MSIRGLFREFAIAKELRELERDRVMSAVWYAAAFQRAEKLPPLEKVLSGASKPRVQTVAEQRTMLESLSQIIGVPLRKAAPRAPIQEHA